MKFAHLIFVLCCFVISYYEVESFKAMGPLGKIIVNSVYDCPSDEKPKGDEFKIKVELVKDGGDKALNIKLDSKLDIDDNINYEIEIKKNENGSWKKFYSVKGKPCRDLDRYIKKIWTNMKAALVPKPEKQCPIAAGSYKIDNFKAATEDIEMKSIFYGMLLLKITATDKSGKRIACVMGEADSQAP